MNSHKYAYWFFEKALSDKFCNDLIKYANQKQERLALTGNKTHSQKLTEKEINDLKVKRNSNIVWLGEKWIYNQIHPFINMANQNAGWNYEWDWSEECQFTKYKLNQFYDWHKDSFQEPFSNSKQKMYFGKIRKLSVTCLLSDPKDYEGGDLEFQPRDQDDPTTIISTNHIKKRGTIIVFPSYTWHRVTPVTKGSRYSLVIWNLGKPYK
jgi:PKHD-type hydroxylase